MANFARLKTDVGPRSDYQCLLCDEIMINVSQNSMRHDVQSKHDVKPAIQRSSTPADEAEVGERADAW